MLEPVALFAQKKMNNDDDDDDTIDEVEDDRLLSCAPAAVTMILFFLLHSISFLFLLKILIFKLISPPSDIISSIAAAYPRSYISYAESIEPFS